MGKAFLLIERYPTFLRVLQKFACADVHNNLVVKNNSCWLLPLPFPSQSSSTTFVPLLNVTRSLRLLLLRLVLRSLSLSPLFYSRGAPVEEELFESPSENPSERRKNVCSFCATDGITSHLHKWCWQLVMRVNETAEARSPGRKNGFR